MRQARPMPSLTIGGIQHVSVLGLGCGSYGSSISETDAYELLDAFVEAGGTLVDTAHVYGAWDTRGVNGGYGNSEVVIGRWLRARGCRRQIVLGTKGGHPDFDSGESCMTQTALMRQLQESLEHLQTDYIDIYWLHRDDRRIPVDEILAWMKPAVDHGVIKVLACSNWRWERIEEARTAAASHALPQLAASQIAWSVAKPNDTITSGKYGEQVSMDDTTWAYHRRTHLPLVAYSAQAGGLFAVYERYGETALLQPDFHKAGLVQRYNNADTWRRCHWARKHAQRLGCSCNQLALAWLLQQPFLVSALVGASSCAQLAEALGALSLDLRGIVYDWQA